MIKWNKAFALLAIFFLLSLCACGAQPQAQPQTTESTTAPTTESTTQPTTAATTTAAPTTTTEPTTTEPPVFSVDDVAMTATPDSSCFSKIGYSEAFETLVVTFRDSGKTYCYTNFPSSAWAAFRSADSLGRYYNTYIKGNYPCEKA